MLLFIRILTLTVLTAFLACLIACSGASSSDRPPRTSEPTASGSDAPAPTSKELGDEHEARRYGQELVSKYLKFPLDAEFDWFPNVSHLSENTWQVQGVVKAKNAFGAQLSHSYRVVVHFYREDEQVYYRANSVFIDGQLVDVSDAALNELAEAAAEVEAEREAEDARLAAQRAERERIAKLDLRFASEARVWTDKSGEFQVKAVYHGFSPGTVTLMKEDHSTIDVALSALSEQDRLFAVKTARERGDLKSRD